MSRQVDVTAVTQASYDPSSDERERIIALLAEVSRALVQGDSVAAGLQLCVESLVRNLDAAFARVWTLNRDENVLELQVSAGLYTHTDGGHARVPVGALKIGQIASDRLPHLTNTVIGDPRVADQEWAKREQMVAFAGYPLLVEDRLVGVVALFARHSLSGRTLYALESIADSVALGIERIRAQEELQASLLRESSARAAAEAEQARSALLAEELARIQAQKDEFLSAAAHDLKTPLAGIQGVAQLISRRLSRTDDLDRNHLLTNVAQITDATRRMDGLINELLDTSRLQMGQVVEYQYHPVDLVTLLTRRVADLRMLTPEHDIVIQSEVTELVVHGDEDRIGRVITNLVDNAIKYSLAGGKITATLCRAREEQEDWAVVCVRDEGIGIPDGDLPYVFQRFFRASNAPATTSGTGIGLAAVRSIVDQHGGTIQVASELGRGSAVTVRLPVAAPSSSAAGDVHQHR